MTRYHVNPETGDASLCKAKVRPCPFGEEFHGDSYFEVEEKYKYFVSGIDLNGKIILNSLDKEIYRGKDVVFSTYTKKNQDIINDPKNKETVDVAKAVYSELQNLEKYKKLDKELSQKLSKMLSTDEEFKETLQEKIDLEKKIASLDSSSTYNDPNNRTSEKFDEDIEEDFEKLDKEYRYLDEETTIDTSAIYDMDYFYNLKDKRDKLAIKLGKPTTEDLWMEEQERRLSKSEEIFKNSKDVDERRIAAIDARDALKILGDESNERYWNKKVVEIDIKKLEGNLEKIKKERFSLSRARRAREVQRDIDLKYDELNS